MAGMFDDLPDVPKGGGGMFDDLPDQTKSLSGFGSNLLSDTGEVASGIASGLYNTVMHPIATAENVGSNVKNLGLGILEKTQAEYPNAVAGPDWLSKPLTSGHEHYAEEAGNALYDKYGNLQNIENQLYNHPVGSLMDASAILSGGETALARAPGVLGKVGDVAGTAARLTNPADLIVRAVQAAKPMQRLGMAPNVADMDVLAKAGVQATPGHMVGGPFQKLEDAATSIPILGSVVDTARNRSVESFNKAVANKALSNLTWLPSQKTLKAGTAAGHDTIQEVATKLGNAYDSVLPKITWTGTQKFADDLNNIRAKYGDSIGDSSQGYWDIPGSIGGTPAPAPGMARFFHGGEDPTSGGSRWATPSADYARNFRAPVDNPNTVSYVDLPKGHPTEVAARQWDQLDEQNKTNMVGRYGNIELPEAVASGLKPYDAPTPGRSAPVIPAFEGNLTRLIGKNGLPTAPLFGKDVKNIESELTKLAGDYRGSATASERQLGQAYGEVVTALRDDIARQAPKGIAKKLQQINQGYAMFARMREAAARRATSQGLFTPNDLLQAIKSSDKSAGKGTFAKGDALLQKFTEAGQRVLPSSLADSGTAYRTAARDLLVGAGTGYAAHALGAFIPAASAAVAATLPYSKPGMAAINRARSRYGSAFRSVTPYAPAAFQYNRLSSDNPYAPQ